jgi:hypothetical protein
MKNNYVPMKMALTECSEMSAYKLQMPANHPEESIQHSEHGKSLKSRLACLGVMVRTAGEWMKQKVWQNRYERFHKRPTNASKVPMY